MIRESSTVKCESSANVSAAVHVSLGRMDPRPLKELAPPVVRPQTYPTGYSGVSATTQTVCVSVTTKAVTIAVPALEVAQHDRPGGDIGESATAPGYALGSIGCACAVCT